MAYQVCGIYSDNDLLEFGGKKPPSYRPREQVVSYSGKECGLPFFYICVLNHSDPKQLKAYEVQSITEGNQSKNLKQKP